MPPRPSRDELLNAPRSGARPLGGSPGPERIPEAPESRSRRAELPAGGQAPESSPRRGRDSTRPGGRTSSTARSSSSSTRRTSSTRPSSGTRRPASSTTTARSSSSTADDDGQAPGKKRGRKRSLPGLPGGSGGARNYQAVILAEFVAAELLVALTPIAARPNQPGLSPYVPRDMTKLLAIGLSYFLLQLISTTGRGAGRFGAWFGALILLAVGINEAASVSKVLNLFAPDTSSSSDTGSSSGPAGGPPAPVTATSKPPAKSGQKVQPIQPAAGSGQTAV